jgi:hypothetical protein
MAEILAAAITEKLTLGQPVTFTATLERRKKLLNRSWHEVECEERKGVVVGTRTLWDGDIEREEAEEEGTYYKWFNPSTHHNAFLVAFALNRKPILVPQSACFAR